MSKDKYNITTGVALSRRQVDGLDAIARRTNTPKSAVMRRAIEIYLKVDAAKIGLQEHVKEKANAAD